MDNGSGVGSSDDGSTPEPFFDDVIDPFAPPVEPVTAAPQEPNIAWHPAYQLQSPAYGYGEAPLQAPAYGANSLPLPQGSGGPPPGYGPYYYPAARKTNGMAIASLICSVVGILLYGIPSLVGLVLGIVALRSIKAHPEQDGHGLALAGVIVGGVVVVLWLIAITVLAVLISNGTINDNGTGSFALLLTHGRTLG